MKPRGEIVVVAGLAALILLVFYPVLGADFIYFDDDVYVFENPAVLAGLAPESLPYAFTRSVSAHWHPLTMLSYMVDVELYGKGPAGFHFTNLLLHTVNTVILFFLLRTMTGAMWRSAFVAAIFAIHPLHVEPVAWISSRKDLLSTMFWLLAIAAYVRHARAPSPGRLALVALAYSAGMLSKSIVVTLPFLLMLLDYWPLNRFSLENFRVIAGRKRVAMLALEKLVLLPVGIVVLLVNAAAQSEAGQVNADVESSVLGLSANALAALASYVYAAVVPMNLALYYPIPAGGHTGGAAGIGAFLLVGIAAIATASLRRYPHVTVGICWFVGTLVPVIGLVQLGGQSHADRYMYFPMIGLLLAAIWGFNRESPKRTYRRFLSAFAIGAVAILSLIAAQQVRLWRDSESIFTHALGVTDNNYLIHYNLARFLESKDRYSEAAEQYLAALEIVPGHPQSHNNLGAILAISGDLPGAIGHFEQAVRGMGSDPVVLCNLATALADSGRHTEANEYLERARAVAPDLPRVKRTEQALAEATAALRQAQGERVSGAKDVNEQE
ncbi:MAG: tetratricopeptide repeat protein [Candidatus Hydrogenedentota bacterium]